MKERERRRLAIRALVFFWALVIVGAALFARLYLVQVRNGRALAAEAGEEQRATIPLSGRRGDIVDRFGVVFATNVPSWEVSAQPGEIVDAHASARALAPLLRAQPASLEETLRARADNVDLARNVVEPAASRISALKLRGITLTPEPTGKHVLPQGSVGSTLVGFTGTDNQGLAGVEYAFDDVLRGRRGTLVEVTDSALRPIPFGQRLEHPAIVGDTVVLTIDRALQYRAERVLAETIRAFDASDGTIVIMQVRTGEVLALANSPGFDPAAGSPSNAAARNRAITDPYEPGSTFKLVTAVAALDSGAVGLDDGFPALDALHVGGRIVHNADDGLMASGHATETLDDIVTFSHNVGAAQVALRVGKQRMFEYIRRFGFDATTGIDLAGESAGIVGTPDAWFGSRLATIGFGQGISVTPLALARAYCAVANGGLLVRPMIVRAVVAPDGRVRSRFAPTIVRRVMSPQTAAEVFAMLRHVVQRGTASAIRIPGFELAGKTGTAQVVEDGGYVPGAYVSSFVGIVPADNPQYVVLVKIDRPRGAYYGSIVAAPAFARVARALLWRERILPHRVGVERQTLPSPALHDAREPHAPAVMKR